MHKILIVDDQEGARLVLKDLLDTTYDVSEAVNKRDCLTKLHQQSFDIIILDLFLSHDPCYDLIKDIRQSYPIPIIVLTSYGDFSKAMEVAKLGVDDFISKDDAEHLLLNSIQNRLKTAQMQTINAAYKEELRGNSKIFIPKNNTQYKAIVEEVQNFAKTSLSFLLLGETGTGKDMLAQYIHSQSDREGPFIRVDCGELDAELLRSELFGHEKGAFTGAENRHIGKIELAHNGTLFLDEIGNMSLALQAKLLTVLDQKQIERVGSTQPVKVDFRLIAATNCCLNDAINTKKFREDLFYRINDIEIYMPTVRDNIDVLPDFIDFFVQQHNRAHNAEFSVNPRMMTRFLSHSWPGNLRELRNRIKKEFLQYHFVGNPSISLADEVHATQTLSNIEIIEKISIEDVLKKSDNNISKAAKKLNISRQSLQYKLKKYKMHPGTTLKE